MSTYPRLSDFLRDRRNSLQPGDVGLPRGGRRRVAGLRREEVAVLADISVDYYMRIEQGRENAPSDQVLDGLARALKLTNDEADYMRQLVHNQRSAATQPPLPCAVQSLIDGWPLAAAQVHDHTLTVVAANDMARTLSPRFSPGHNPFRDLFTVPEMRIFYRDWARVTEWAVQWIRAYVSHEPALGLINLIDELSTTSDRFRELWSHHRVHRQSSGMLLLRHPQVGPLDLHYQHMVVPASRHVVVVYWADPGSDSASTLQRLVDRMDTHRVD